MRTTDTPFFVSAKDGHVQFQCGGTTARLEPALALRAGQRLIARVKGMRHGKLAETPERSLEAGNRLIASAAEASRQCEATVVTLPAAA